MLSCSHQKASAHSAALLDFIVVRIDSTTVAGLYNEQCMPIIHKKHIRDLCVERKNVTRPKPMYLPIVVLLLDDATS